MKKTFLLTLLLVFELNSYCQTKDSSSNIKNLLISIEEKVRQDHITGLMLGITTKDSVIFSGGFGYADLENRRKVDENTLFRMGSITKMFVSLGIMKLVSEGKLNLNDELKRIVPEVLFQNDWEETNPVRIVHLLEHTSGFDDIKLNAMYSLDTNENKGMDMILAHKNSMVTRWKPGERFSYCNPNYTILGYLIEKISGKPYDNFLKESILTPLGMANTNFNVRSKFSYQDVKEYVLKNGVAYQVNSVTLLSGPSGALWSNASDMLKFLRIFLDKGKSIFSAEIISEMETPHSSLAAKFGLMNGYSLGIENTFFPYAKFPYKGHGGELGTCRSALKYNSELGIGYVIASNSNTSTYEVEQLIVSYFEKNQKGKALATQKVDKNAITPFLGRYQFESPRNEIAAFSDRLQTAPEIFLEDDRLYLKPLMGERIELVQTAPMTFAFQWTNMPLICFTKNSEGENVMMMGGGYYEQTSNFWALLKRAIILIAILVVMSSILFGFISLINKFRAKLSWGQAVLRMLPLLSLAVLVWIVTYVFQIKEASYRLSELNAPNVQTLVIFLGSSFFGIFSITSLVYSILFFRKQKNLWLSFYILMLSISFSILTFVLSQGGWIGLRTWAM